MHGDTCDTMLLRRLAMSPVSQDPQVKVFVHLSSSGASGGFSRSSSSVYSLLT
jgi:hypothetical protein